MVSTLSSSNMDRMCSNDVRYILELCGVFGNRYLFFFRETLESWQVEELSLFVELKKEEN